MTDDAERAKEPARDQATEDAGAEATASAARVDEAPAAEPVVPPSRPLWLRVTQLVLPPVLAAAAVGMHWAVNVPDKIVESPSDQGAKDKKPEKKKPAGRKSTTKRDETRTQAALDADWETYRDTPFDEEPTRTAWARRHQVVINRAVVEARRSAFAGAPEDPNVVLSGTACRTVRCRFQLRSPFPHEIDLMTSTLQRLEESGEPVWRTFDVETLPSTPKSAESDASHVAQVTVSFRTDETDTNGLEIPSLTPEAEPKADEPEPENGGEPNEDGENGGEPNEDGEPENG